MSFIYDYVEKLRFSAEGIAVKARALKKCAFHTDILVWTGDPDAETLAYAIGTNKWKSGEIVCDRSDLMDAIKEAITMSAEECPECTKHRYED